MAIALGLDPAWTTSTAVNIISAAFSPVANSLIIVESHVDDTTSPTITDSVGLTWTAIGTPQAASTGGRAAAWWAFTASARTNMTVTVNWSSPANKAIKVKTWTGTASASAVISKAQSVSTTSPLNLGVATTNDGCRISGSALDWNARGGPTSSDDEVSFTVAGAISGTSVHKAANSSGVGTSVTLNIVKGTVNASAADWAYKVYEIVPAAGGTSSVTLTPATVTSSAVLVTPIPQPVTLTLTPATATLSAITTAPTGAVTLIPAGMTSTAPPVTVTPGAVNITLTPAVATLSAPSVQSMPTTSSVTLTPAVTTTTAPAVTATPQPGAVTLTAVTRTITAVAITATPQPVIITLSPAVTTTVAVAMSVGGVGGTTLTPAVLTTTASSVTATPGAVTKTLTSASTTVAAIPLGVTPLAVTITLTPAVMTVTALGVGLGAIGATTLTPAQLTTSARALTTAPGPVNVTLTTATITFAVPAVVATPGAININISVAQATILLNLVSFSAVPTSEVTLAPAQLTLSTFSGVYVTKPGVDLMTIAFATVTGVGEYIRGELVATEGGVPKRFAHVVPGQIAWDNCDCGQFAQTINSVASSRVFPAPASDIPEQPCGHPLAVVSVTVSLLRCVPGLDSNGNAPSVRTLLETARVIEEDRQVLRRSVSQHLKVLRNEYKIVNYTVGTAQSVGPEGQCGGIELMYSFGINNDAMVC